MFLFPKNTNLELCFAAQTIRSPYRTTSDLIYLAVFIIITTTIKIIKIMIKIMIMIIIIFTEDVPNLTPS